MTRWNKHSVVKIINEQKTQFKNSCDFKKPNQENYTNEAWSENDETDPLRS